MSGIPRRISEEHDGSGEFKIPSSEPGKFYYPRLTVHGERVTGWCSCDGFRFHGACRHLAEAKVILNAERREAAQRLITQTTHGTYAPELDRTPVLAR